MGNLVSRSKLSNKLGMLMLVLTILTAVITITINAYPIYVLEVKRLHLAEMLGLSQDQLLHNYRQVMAYLNYPWVKEFHMDNFIHSESGAFHFQEVKRLFMINYGVLFITIIPSILYIKRLIKSGTLWRLVRPFQMMALIPVVLGVLLVTSFDRLFIAFHHFFFNNDDWLFDPVTDPIINALPESYFMWCFIFAVILFETCLFIGIYQGKKRL